MQINWSFFLFLCFLCKVFANPPTSNGSINNNTNAPTATTHGLNQQQVISGGGTQFDPRERKLTKKKKINHTNPMMIAAMSSAAPTLQLPPVTSGVKPHKKLNANNQILNAKTNRASTTTTTAMEANDTSNEYDDECIIIDESDPQQSSSTSSANPNVRTTLLDGDASLPANLPANIVAQINNLLDTFNKRNLQAQSMWPDDFKLILLKIYTDMQKLPFHDKTQLVNFLTVKLKRPKESLAKICKRMSQKEHTTTNTTNATAQHLVKICVFVSHFYDKRKYINVLKAKKRLKKYRC